MIDPGRRDRQTLEPLPVRRRERLCRSSSACPREDGDEVCGARAARPMTRCQGASSGARFASKPDCGSGRRTQSETPLGLRPQDFCGGLAVLFLPFGSGATDSGLLAKRRLTRSLKSSGVTACALPVVNSRAIFTGLRFIAQGTGLRGGNTRLCTFLSRSTTANS